MRWQRNLLHQGVLKGGRSHRAPLNMSLKILPSIHAIHRWALSISREHLRLYRLQRLTRMRHVNCTTQNPAADIESLLFSAYIWKAFVRCLPSAGLVSKRQRKSKAWLFFPAQSMGRAAHCLWSHKAFKNGQEAGKKVRYFSLGSSWEGWSSPTTFHQIKMPAAYQTPLYRHPQPAPSVT